MSSNEDRAIGIEEARKHLGPIANRAHLAGEITYLTRNGTPIAAVVPLDRIKETAVSNAQDIADQIRTTLDTAARLFDVDAIVEEIGDTYGRDVTNIDAIPSDEYWAIVEKHDKAAATATDITVTIDRPADDSGWNWAEVATGQWIAAAEKAGLTVELVSEEVQHVDSEAAIVSVNDTKYVLDVHGDEVRAVPADEA